MTRQTSAGEDYRQVLDPRHRRKVLLLRAALALSVMLVLIAGLNLFDTGTADVPQPQPARVAGDGLLPLSLPAPGPAPQESGSLIPRIDVSALPAPDDTHAAHDEVMSAVTPAVTTVDVTRHAAADDVPDVAVPDVARAPADTDAASQTPSVRDDAKVPEVVSDQASESASESASEPAIQVPPPPAPTQTAAKTPKTAGSAASAAARFQVLASDFIDPATADSLRDGLSAQGYRAASQNRVTVGPFARRVDAERALARVISEHGLRGIIVDAPSGAGLALQLGVFSEAANAQALVKRLQASGHAAAMHRRVALGPYPDRAAAESIVAALGAERALDARIIALPTR